jgi:gamma-glutamyltranspeptidase/glutathione hydrolase
MLQVWFNIVEFGLSVQAAIEAPRFATFNFPNSFAPHSYLPGRLCLENGITESVCRALVGMNHDIQRWPRFTAAAGAVCAILRDPESGLLHAGADPRREAYAAAW